MSGAADGLVLHALGERVLQPQWRRLHDDPEVIQDSEGGAGDVNGVTLQFRKTKTDQEAFGNNKTLYSSGVSELCVVGALVRFRNIAPQRFGQGCEALKPLFRWANGQTLKRTHASAKRAAEAGEGSRAPQRKVHVALFEDRRASALFQATGEIELVKRTGRWSSAAVQRYLHDGEVALRETARKMANVEQRVHYT